MAPPLDDTAFAASAAFTCGETIERDEDAADADDADADTAEEETEPRVDELMLAPAAGAAARAIATRANGACFSSLSALACAPATDAARRSSFRFSSARM